MLTANAIAGSGGSIHFIRRRIAGLRGKHAADRRGDRGVRKEAVLVTMMVLRNLQRYGQ